MHWVVTGRAFSRLTEISSAQDSQIPKGAVFDPLERLADFFDQLGFAIPDAEREIAVGLQGGPVRRVRECFGQAVHPGHGVVRLAEELSHALFQVFLKKIQVLFFHGDLMLLM